MTVLANLLPSISVALDERSKYLRRLAVRTLDKGERGHIGSTMSLIETLRVLYDDILQFRPKEPEWIGRDRMILSSGLTIPSDRLAAILRHAGPELIEATNHTLRVSIPGFSGR